MQAVDALPYVQNVDLVVDGKEIVLEEDQKAQLEQQIADLFEDSHTMPAFGVIFGNDFETLTQNGTFVSLKFERVFEVNGLPFDELVFQVCSDWTGFNLFRGMNGVFEGRCIYIDLVNKDMSALYNFINALPQDTQTSLPEELPEQDVQQPVENIDESVKQEVEIAETTQQEDLLTE